MRAWERLGGIAITPRTEEQLSGEGIEGEGVYDLIAAAAAVFSSFLAFNLAHLLSEEFKILAVDLDPQGNLSLAFGVGKDENRALAIFDKSPKIDLVPSNIELSRVESNGLRFRPRPHNPGALLPGRDKGSDRHGLHDQTGRLQPIDRDARVRFEMMDRTTVARSVEVEGWVIKGKAKGPGERIERITI